MSSVPDPRVDARLTAEGLFALTIAPSAPRDLIVGGLLQIPAGAVYAGLRPSATTAQVLLFAPAAGDDAPGVGGWTPRVPPQPGARPPAVDETAVRNAITTLLAATALELPALVDLPATVALRDLLARLLDRPSSPWRSPHTA